MRGFFVALQFLTILPLPFPARWDERDLGRSMAWFPAAGLTLGLMLAGLDRLAGWVFPRGITDLLLVVFLTAVTGALHLDGLADVSDGIAARGGRERFLAVMKDSHTGAVGAAAVSLSLLLKYVALLNVPEGAKTGALLLFPMAGRYAQVAFTAGSLRARADGLGSLFVGTAGRTEILVATAVSLSAAWLLLGLSGLCIFLGVLLLAWMLKKWFHRRLGGITGDTIGCTSELNEILALLLITALAGKG
jgi:adenosylcobinamide-GDP ribazoletransferase